LLVSRTEPRRRAYASSEGVVLCWRAASYQKDNCQAGKCGVRNAECGVGKEHLAARV
jgi:hypothetical protein